VRAASWAFMDAVRSWVTRSTSVAMGEGYHPGYPSRVLRGVTLLLFLAAPPPRSEAGTAVARLAAEMATAVLGVARGRAVEVAPSAEGGLPAGAADWRALLLARLEGHVALTADGPRVRVEWVVSEAPSRLLASARLVEEPGERLLDIVSVSAPWDEGTVPLAPLRPVSPRTTVDVLATSRSAPLDGVVLALAWVADDRVLTVFRDEAALYRLEPSALALESRQPLPRPLSPVRSPGALAVVDGGAAWVLSSAAGSAALLAVEGNRLVVRSRAEALPFAGSPAGLRFRPGTNLIECAAEKLGHGPFLALEPSGTAGVDADGELWLPTREGGTRAGLRVGSAVASLWAGMLAVSSPAAPSGEDAVSFVGVSDRVATLAETIPLEGTIRALASRASGEGVRLVAAVEEAGGRSRLTLMDLRRRQP